MSRLNDDLAKAFQLVNGIGAAPGVDVNARLQALQQLQAQMDRVMCGLRGTQADQLKKEVDVAKNDVKPNVVTITVSDVDLAAGKGEIHMEFKVRLKGESRMSPAAACAGRMMEASNPKSAKAR